MSAAEVAVETARLRRLAETWDSMAGPPNSVYETCARDLRAVLAATDQSREEGPRTGATSDVVGPAAEPVGKGSTPPLAALDEAASALDDLALTLMTTSDENPEGNALTAAIVQKCAAIVRQHKVGEETDALPERSEHGAFTRPKEARFASRLRPRMGRRRR